MVKDETFSRYLDKLSENIVYLLSIDCRRPLTEMADELGVTRRKVENRVEKLFANGFVRSAIVNNAPPAIYVTILVELRFITQPLIDKIRKLPTLTVFRETTGMYDFSITCHPPSREAVGELVRRVSALLHRNTINFDVLPHEFMGALTYESFCHKPELRKEFSMIRPADREVTAQEAKVLRALETDARMSYRDISRVTGIHYERVSDAVAALKKDGFLQCTLYPDYRKLGLEYHYYLARVEPLKRQEFEDYITKHPRVHWVKPCVLGFSRWDYVLSVVAQSTDDYIDLTRQIRTDNQSILSDHTELINKLRYAWAEKPSADNK